MLVKQKIIFIYDGDTLEMTHREAACVCGVAIVLLAAPSAHDHVGPGEPALEEPVAGEYGAELDSMRGMQEVRFQRAKTSVGGYRELHSRR